ncbi:phosphotransferase family protein [Novosphingobium resinovorum]|uniref:phosphotransferase family protein n=1 Tax=Novosphingobium TaxID=165696 RepID=UPI001B3C8212|nr:MULTISPECIES: phosphotransferase family protein [Novosphingobium]MBF7014428.1 phosphotransferase family protein [Novosphingobium sp. HR1a]WJM25088.1 phosphotransferase family protein [Novosphingobium resinovorum]
MQTQAQRLAQEPVAAIDRDAIEPRLLEILLAKQERRKLGPYIPRTAPDIAEGLSVLFAREGIAARARGVRRMGGGASKEQFVFDVEGEIDPAFARCVLRMDPREGIIETCRRREAQVLRAVAGVVPVPPVLTEDGDGETMGQPLMVTGFVGGVTKPIDSGAGPSGLKARFGESLGHALTSQFIGHLAAIHAVDYRAAGLDDFVVPRPETTDAALWQVNYWTRVRALEETDSLPLLTLAETWLYDHLPVCEQPVLLHGDYRVGNFLFDEERQEITALLDWELTHIGDFHEDIAYSFEPLFGHRDADGVFHVGSMFTTGHLISRYEALTGRTVNPATLHWYRVLTSYKLIAMNHCSSIIAARDGTNHQNALLAFLASCTAGMSDTLCELLSGEMA